MSLNRRTLRGCRPGPVVQRRSPFDLHAVRGGRSIAPVRRRRRVESATGAEHLKNTDYAAILARNARVEYGNALLSLSFFESKLRGIPPP